MTGFNMLVWPAEVLEKVNLLAGRLKRVRYDGIELSQYALTQ